MNINITIYNCTVQCEIQNADTDMHHKALASTKSTEGENKFEAKQGMIK